MPLSPRQEQELVGGGDTLQHYHLADRGPFPISHGSFYDTTSQPLVSTTAAQVVTINSTDYSYGVSIEDNSKIVTKAPGTYNIQFSFQAGNSGTTHAHFEVWLSKNGVDVPNSNTLIDVPEKHGGDHGHTVAAWNFYVRMKRNDYVQLMWCAETTDITLLAFPAGTSPARPATPSVIVTANLVSI